MFIIKTFYKILRYAALNSERQTGSMSSWTEGRISFKCYLYCEVLH